MSIKQYTAKKLLANIITINKKLLDMTLGLAEAFKGNTVGFIIGEVDSDVTELTNRRWREGLWLSRLLVQHKVDR